MQLTSTHVHLRVSAYDTPACILGTGRIIDLFTGHWPILIMRPILVALACMLTQSKRVALARMLTQSKRVALAHFSATEWSTTFHIDLQK